MDARCAVHGDRSASVTCFRCGTFVCEACTPAPSVLCPDCVARLPVPAHRWSEVPAGPRPRDVWLRRVLVAVVAFFPLLAVIVGAGVGLPPRLVAAVTSLVFVVALVVRIVRLARNPLFRGMMTGRALLRDGEPRRAAVVLEEALRRREGTPALRTLALLTFSSAVMHGGGAARALSVAEAVRARGWTGDMGAVARLVAIGALARSGRFEEADQLRNEVRLTWRARRRTTLADTDGFLAARRGDDGRAHEELATATAWATRQRFPAIAAWTALLDAFVLERAGASETEIEAALATGRTTKPELLAGLTTDWPELTAFVARRLRPHEPSR